ncbi:LuxR C-terminal-related transcriptional regulator [Catenulispora yoronensis]
MARILERAAGSATRRGSSLAAVTWLTRAAELSQTRAERSRRLADAAFVAGYAGLGQAHRLLPDDPSPAAEAPAAVLAAASQALYRDGDVRTSRRRVVAALHALRDSGMTEPDDVFTRLETLLLSISLFAGDRDAWSEVHELFAGFGSLVGDRSRIFCDTWSDVVRHGAGRAEPVQEAAAALAGLAPWDVTRLAAAAHHLDLLALYRPHLQRVVDRELETGAAFSGAVMLRLILIDQIASGEWDEAERTGQRALDAALDQGLELFAHLARGFLALLSALRGRTARARVLQAEVDAWARPRGLGYLIQLADAAALMAALSDGDYEAAYQYATGITPPGSFRPYTHQAPRTLLDLVEAARHTGRADEARRHALAARDADLPELSPRLALLTYGALAMTAEDETEAAEMFALAESHPEAPRFPFELARVRLAHGISVRRTEGRTAAGPLLAAAAESFERLGAEGWAERARAELRASGTTGRATSTNPAALTWQERLIADLAASGLTNKEIGEQMHLSSRTVSSHLYRIFPKLGITTRSALRDVLNRVDSDAATPPCDTPRRARQ